VENPTDASASGPTDAAASGRISAFAPAKINLMLHVGDRRLDGFHALESLVVFADAGDMLNFEASDTLSLKVEGPFAMGLDGEGDNLVLRAARALAEYLGREATGAITLTKNLPVASGIGGGSADAAAALRGLARLWGADPYAEDLRSVAEALGSDVPVCVACRPAWMEGRGELLSPAKKMPTSQMVLVNPGVAVPTGRVFAGLRTRRGVSAIEHPVFERETWTLVEFLKETGNDLEAPALAIAPVIGEVLAALRAQPGAMLARMSGSGATCFALFGDDDAGAAPNAAQALKAAHPDWWITAAQIIG
jgi:4-diphosphocytidyl-2-C-methyl-D-erythritol kinase